LPSRVPAALGVAPLGCCGLAPGAFCGRVVRTGYSVARPVTMDARLRQYRRVSKVCGYGIKSRTRVPGFQGERPGFATFPRKVTVFSNRGTMENTRTMSPSLSGNARDGAS